MPLTLRESRTMLHRLHESKIRIMSLRPASAMPCKLPHFTLLWDRSSRLSQRSAPHRPQWVERLRSQSLHLTTSLHSTYRLSTASMQKQLQRLRTETRTAVMAANTKLLLATQTALGNKLQQGRVTKRASPTRRPRARMQPRLAVENLCLPTKPTARGDDRMRFAANLHNWILGSNSRLQCCLA
jgi:hypothetical protein